MAQNDIYLVRQKVDGTFEEIAHSPFRYDAANITDLPDKANNTFHINTKLRVDELEVNGKTTVIHTDTNTSEQLLVTNDGTGPAAVINQLGQHPLIDIQDDGNSALFIRGDAPYGGFVGLGTVTPDEQLHLTGSILLENEQLLMAKNISNTKVNILGMTDGDITNLNNVGNGITMSVGASTASPQLFMHPTGKVGLGIETNEPDGLLELKRDGESNLLLSHRTASILATINVDKPEDKVSFKTITDHDLSFGTNALDFLTLSKEGNLKLQKKLSGSTLTGGDLTIDGNLKAKGDMASFGSEEILFSKSLTSSGTNVAKAYRILEVGYNTQHWDHGTSFIIEVYSNHYSSQGYQKYILNHTYLDTSTGGSQDGLVDKVGSRDYVLKILEHEGDAGSYEFRARLGAPEDTGVNVNNFDVALVPLYIDVTNYANVRVKVTSFNSDSCKRISVDENWGAVSADDEYKFNPLPTAEDITWGDYADLPGTLDYTFAGRQALYADVLFGDGRINRIGNLGQHQSNIQWSLKLADINTSLTVPGKVGIGTSDPDFKLTVDNGIGNEGLKVIAGNNGDSNESIIEAWNWKVNGSDPDLLFKVRGDGNVGIGVSNFNARLEVATRTVDELAIRAVASNEYSLFDIRKYDNGDTVFLNTYYSGGSGASGDFLFKTTDNAAGAAKNTRMIIKQDGDVGIGTTDPIGPLHIKNTDANQINLTRALDIRGSSNGASAEIHGGALVNTSPSMGGAIGFTLKDSDGTGSGTNTDGLIYFKVKDSGGSLTEKMRIDSAGNVGIGSTNPGHKLRVAGNVKIGDNEDITPSPGGDGQLMIDGVGYTSYVALDEEAMHIGHNSTVRDLRLGTNETTNLTIKPYGSVGIGTTIPQSNLDIVDDYAASTRIWARSDQSLGGGALVGAWTQWAVKHQAGTDGAYGTSDDNPDYSFSWGIDSTETSGSGNDQMPRFKLGYSYQGWSKPSDSDKTLMSFEPNGNIGIDAANPREKLEINDGRLLVTQYETPSGSSAAPVIAATFFARRQPSSNGSRYGCGIDIMTMGHGEHTSPAIRFYDSAANGDYDGTTVGDNNWIIGADDTDTSSFKLSYGGGQNTVKPNSIVNATSRLSIDGPTGVATFSGPLSIAEAIRHTGDTNTYFGFPNTDQFSVVTNGSTRLQITATSTTVNNQLRAQGGMTIATNEDNDTPELTLKRSSSTNEEGNDDICDIRVGDSTLAFYINNDDDADAGSYHFYKMANGSQTYATLHAGTVDIQGNITHGGDSNTYFGFHNNDEWRVVTGGAERLEVTNSSINLRANTGVTGNLTISGDLTVNGDVVTLNTTNLDIEDKIIKVAKGATSDADADGSGISFGGSAELIFKNSGNKLLAQGCSSIEMASTGPKFILKDTNSTDSVNQTGNISYQLANGTVSAEIGHMSNSNSDFQIKTVDGDIDIRPGGSGHKLEYNGSEVATRTYVDNNSYSHPTFNSDDFSIDTGAMTGAKVISDLDINVTTNSEGHVTDANGTVSTRNLTLADLGYTGATNANNYSHPTGAGNKHIPSGGAVGQFLKYSSSGTAVWASDNNTTYSVGDGGLTQKNFTTTLKNKLDGIADGATAVTNNSQIANGRGFITSVPTNTVTNASVSGNTLTLSRQGGTDVTFTATTTSGSGTGGSTDAVEKTGAQTMQGPLTITQKDSTGASLLASGDVIAMTSASDERLKTNILKIDSALDKVCSLEGFTFDWNQEAKQFGIDSPNSEVGLSAQATEKVVPEAVKTFSNSDYKYINYEKLVPLLVEAVKELKSEIEELKNNCCDCKK